MRDGRLLWPCPPASCEVRAVATRIVILGRRAGRVRGGTGRRRPRSRGGARLPSSTPTVSAVRRCCAIACRRRRSSPPPGCAPNCAEPPIWGSTSISTTPRSRLPEIHQRVKTLAAAQSADITAELLSMGVELIAGQRRAGRRDLGAGAPLHQGDRPRWRHHHRRRRRGTDRDRRQSADPAVGAAGRRADSDLAPALRPGLHCPTTSSWWVPG